MRVPSCSSPELRLETCSEKTQITVLRKMLDSSWLDDRRKAGKMMRVRIFEHFHRVSMHIGVACENLLRHQPEGSSTCRHDDRYGGI